VIGMVLAAGAGRRLRPDTDALPKTLLPVDGTTTILDIALRNLAAVGLTDVAVIVGHAAGVVADRAAGLERDHGVRLDLIHNDRAQDWNNAYSLWLAREYLGRGALLVNGDTVHPVSVEQTLLAAQQEELPRAGLILAIDTLKPLADEEMKVILDGRGLLRQISKQLDPATAHGEYIGATLIRPAAAIPLADALEATWRRDPGLYYEDGYQELARRGVSIAAVPIGRDPPNEVNVVIEVPIGGEPIKYEMHKPSGALMVDRFLYTSMRYPGNYGFIPHTLSGDGDPCDVLIANTRALTPGVIMSCRIVGVMVMEDEAGGDEKLIGVPGPKLTQRYDHVHTLTDLPEITLKQIEHFFSHYKDLEPGKWVKIVRWGDADMARQMVLDGIERAKAEGKE